MREKVLALSFLFLCLPAWAVAGLSVNAAGTGNFTLEQTAYFAKQVEKSLAHKGARVALVGRVGMPPKDLPDGIRFTHVALWVYSTIKTADGRELHGYQAYSLYQKNEALDQSQLMQDFPVDFFTGVHALKAGVIIPKPALQQAILRVIESGAYKRLHNPRYSVVSSPFNNQYQNCTEHTLNVLLAALYGTENMDQLKTNAAAYFTPQTVRLDPVRSLLGPVFVPDFTTRDHEGAIQVVTFTTLKNFMRHYNLTQEDFTLN